MKPSFAEVDPFHITLSKHNTILTRDRTNTLQINVGLQCNQHCRHCHLDAGPDRTEHMNAETAAQVMDYAERTRFDCIDITGGAPELNPNIEILIEKFSCYTQKLMFRANLTALNKRDDLIDLLSSRRAVIVASFPSLNEAQTNAQRGDGIFLVSIDTLKKLNGYGYGKQDTGLELNLVSNPTGAFLPPSQQQTEKLFRDVLKKKMDIVFNNLFNFANVPLGRFKTWLKDSGNYDAYLKKLAENFNPCSIESVMCRTLVSVSWNGYLYDCDFNLARGLFMGNKKIHVSEISGKPDAGAPIATADHCYTCTAGAGFT